MPLLGAAGQKPVEKPFFASAIGAPFVRLVRQQDICRAPLIMAASDLNQELVLVRCTLIHSERQ